MSGPRLAARLFASILIRVLPLTAMPLSEIVHYCVFSVHISLALRLLDREELLVAHHPVNCDPANYPGPPGAAQRYLAGSNVALAYLLVGADIFVSRQCLLYDGMHPVSALYWYPACHPIKRPHKAVSCHWNVDGPTDSTLPRPLPFSGLYRRRTFYPTATRVLL